MQSQPLKLLIILYICRYIFFLSLLDSPFFYSPHCLIDTKCVHTLDQLKAHFWYALGNNCKYNRAINTSTYTHHGIIHWINSTHCYILYHWTGRKQQLSYWKFTAWYANKKKKQHKKQTEYQLKQNYQLR